MAKKVNDPIYSIRSANKVYRPHKRKKSSSKDIQHVNDLKINKLVN